MSNEDNSDQNSLKRWEKRVNSWIITGLVGFIAVTAVEVKTQMEVMLANYNNSVKTIESHTQELKEHDTILDNHDRRLIKIETIREPSSIKSAKSGT